MLPRRLLLAALCVALLGIAQGQQAVFVQPAHPEVRIAFTPSTETLLVSVATALKEKKKLQAGLIPGQTSADALDSLGTGHADIALMTRPLTGLERAQYPDLDFVTTPIGMQVVALGISTDLWDAGLHALGQKEIRAIYEQKVTNWKDVGGPDEKIAFFSFREGSGIWEILAEWLYGDNRKAPLPKVDSIASSSDARDTLEFTPGAIAPIGASLVDGSRCHALGVMLTDHVGWPTAAQVASGQYPLVKPMFMVSVGRPTLEIRVVTDFLTGPQGQKLIVGSGSLGLDAVPKPAADSQ
jgi:phosphate transport system substrate-binding protein